MTYNYYQPYLNLLAARLGRLADDDRGQAETTEMLIRIAFAVAIIALVVGLLFTAISNLGQEVAGDIGGAGGGW